MGIEVEAPIVDAEILNLIHGEGVKLNPVTSKYREIGAGNLKVNIGRPRLVNREFVTAKFRKVQSSS